MKSTTHNIDIKIKSQNVCNEYGLYVFSKCVHVTSKCCVCVCLQWMFRLCVYVFAVVVSQMSNGRKLKIKKPTKKQKKKKRSHACCFHAPQHYNRAAAAMIHCHG